MNHLPAFPSPLARTQWVRGQLRLLGKSFASLARELGCTRNAVAAAMNVPLDAQEKAIAAALGVDQQALFPERYTPDGQRLHHVRKSSANGESRTVKHDEAA